MIILYYASHTSTRPRFKFIPKKMIVRESESSAPDSVATISP